MWYARARVWRYSYAGVGFVFTLTGGTSVVAMVFVFPCLFFIAR